MRVLWASLFALFLVLPELSGGYDAFLRIEGIEGGSEVVGRDGWMDLAAVSHGGVRPGDSGAGDYSPVVLFKEIDRATPLLAQRVAAGAHSPEAVVDFVRRDARGVRFYRIVLEEVYVQRVAFETVSGSDERPLERIELNFARIEWTYTEYAEDGTEVGDHIAYWDRAARTGGSESPGDDAPPPDPSPDGFRYRVSLAPVEAGGSTAVLTWNSIEGQEYEVYYSPIPEGPYDTLVATVTSDGDGTTSTTVDLQGDRGFFIISVPD